MNNISSIYHHILSKDRFYFCDIGARGGLPSGWDELGENLFVIAFEPDEKEALSLAEKIQTTGAKTKIIPKAVWDKKNQQTLYITQSPGCSSILVPNLDFLQHFPDVERFNIVEKLSMDLLPLDDVVAAGNLKIDFLKIDVQGGGLKVLEGGKKTLEKTLGLEMEVEFAPLYSNGAFFGDIDKFMRESEFELVDIKSAYWRRDLAKNVPGAKGQIVFCDTLYLRSPEKLAEMLEAESDENKEKLLAKAFMTAMAYDLHDRIITYGNCSSLRKKEWVINAMNEARKGPRFARLSFRRYRYALGQVLKDIADALLIERNSWAMTEQAFGNRLRHRRSRFLK